MRKKILVVDDESDLVELIAFNLEREGYSVSIARDGWQAVDRAREILPDLILLDVMLPELDGFAVCEILKSQLATAGIPVLMLTACGTGPARAIGLGLGAAGYLTKPFSTAELLDQVRTILQPDDRCLELAVG